MITFLVGVIEDIGADRLAINVNGVGYDALCSGRTLGQLATGQETKIYIHTHVREDQLTLFGFAEPAEREMFRTLININGVGPKVGLAILAALSPQEIAEAVMLQSGKTMARANGVGPKLGERIVLELKGKLGILPTISTNGAAVQTTAGTPAADAMSALTNMGFKEYEAHKAVSKAVNNMPDAAFDALFKSALKELR